MSNNDITQFVEGRGFSRFPLSFDTAELQRGLHDVLSIVDFESFVVKAVCLTQIPDDPDSFTGGNLRGRYWTRPDDNYEEVLREQLIDEVRYSQFVSQFDHTCFKTIYDQLSEHLVLGRMRLLKTVPRTSLSWHRDPEPRVHIPIITNPGAMMVIDNHATHLPADGSVYFTDTRYYHSAFNGGEQDRVHLVATIVDFKNQHWKDAPFFDYLVLKMLCKVSVNEFPVDQAPECRQIIRAYISEINVVCVFPQINRQ